MKNIYIIGAGLAGLSASVHGVKRNYKVNVFESSNLIGGERGLIAFFEKKEKLMILENENYSYKSKLENLKAKKKKVGGTLLFIC